MNIKNKKMLVSLLVVVIAIIGLIGYKTLMINTKQVQGSKEYILVVRDSENSFKKEYNYKTEEVFVGKDLDVRGIIKTDNSGTSRFVTGVDGKEADGSKQEWWNIKINGEDSKTGIDEISINNGDKIEFVLTTGW